jgi:hypothetical membrane protein
MVQSTPELVPRPAPVKAVPWWGIVSSVVAPLILISGWAIAADLQPHPFDEVRRSISALGADGMPYRWVIAVALLGVGTCNVITGLALRPAAEPGRILLMIGGISSMLIGLNPQGAHSGSLPHEAFSLIGVVVMTIWPLAAIRRDPGAPFGLRPPAAYATTAVTLVVLLWFTIELFNGAQLGLAERTATADQSIWPLIVVASVLATSKRSALAAEHEAAVRSR